MDDPNLVLDFIHDERLNVLEELKEHELNLRKVIENVPMDEDFRDLLAVLINSYLSFEKNAAKALANIDDLEEKAKKRISEYRTSLKHKGSFKSHNLYKSLGRFHFQGYV